MLENCRTAKERWGGVSEIIDRWLKERQELIVRYCELTREEATSDSLHKDVEEFCEVLMDYMSAAHFEVYEQLVHEAREFDDGGVELAATMYPRLEVITQAAVAFNDHFDAMDPTEAGWQDDILTRLSALGGLLEERFELEDALIEALHNVHADQMA